MMKNMAGWLVVLSVLGFGLCASAAVRDKQVMVPATGDDYMATTDQDDAFANCPLYAVNTVRRVVRYNGWTGPEDASFTVRGGWSEQALVLRFDVVDDKVVPGDEDEPGDHLTVYLAYLTAGPTAQRIDKGGEHRLVLFPNPVGGECEVLVDSSRPGALGEPETKVFATADGYSVLLSLPFTDWEQKPRSRSATWLQVLLDDADDDENPAVAQHRVAMFPGNRRQPGAETESENFGRMRFVDDTWLHVSAGDVIYSDSKLKLEISWGNLSNADVDAEVVVKSTKKSDDPGLVTAKVLPQGEIGRETMEVDMTAAAAGTYTVRTRAGLFSELNSVEVTAFAGGIGFCPELIEKRIQAPDRRPLTILRDADRMKQTMRYIAGGGTVLWQVGKYNAGSHGEFPQRIRPRGALEVSVPSGKADDVPWALFGGQDQMDGMAEPLVLKLEPGVLPEQQGLVPDDYMFAGDKYKKRKLGKTKALLLLGVTFDYLDADSLPELHVLTDGKTVLKQKLAAPADTALRSRLVYVARVWLEGGEKQISIENSAVYGPRLEVDFMALMGPGAGTDFEPGSGRLRFEGTPEAALFNRQLATNLFFMRHYLVDAAGQAYTSLPGGRRPDFAIGDYGMLMGELANWGCDAEAKLLVDYIPAAYRDFRSYGTTATRVSVGHMAVVTGLYNAWRKAGQARDYISRNSWQQAVHRPLGRVLGERDTNPLGLPNCVGEYGVNGPDPGTTTPMYFASRAALGSAIAMAAKVTGEGTELWRRGDRNLQEGFRNLVAVESGFEAVSSTRYPESWTLRAQTVMTRLPEDCWIYGRHENGNAVFYDNGIRVVDTPYLVAGLGYWLDYRGFHLEDPTAKQLLSTYTFLKGFSPVMRSDSWRRYALMDYKSSLLQQWMIQAGFVLDDTVIASRVLESFIKYTYDEQAPLALQERERSSMELSPFTFEEKLNAADDGSNIGASYDELTIQCGVTALRSARIFAGIDDYDLTELRLLPRLPAGWRAVTAEDWPIAHDFEKGAVARISYSYQQVSPGRYRLQLESPEPLRAVTVRVGPFEALVRKVQLTAAGQTASVNTVREGVYNWAYRTYRDVGKLQVSAQASMY